MWVVNDDNARRQLMTASVQAVQHGGQRRAVSRRAPTLAAFFSFSLSGLMYCRSPELRASPCAASLRAQNPMQRHLQHADKAANKSRPAAGDSHGNVSDTI